MRMKLFMLLIFCVYKCFAKKGCTEILGQLANTQSTFVHCAVQYSIPATSCVHCHDEYRNIIVHYKKLVANCSDVYISQNRLNMVYNMELYLDAIWNKGFCDDCWIAGSDAISNDTSKFNDLSAIFDTCLNNHPKTPCPSCMRKYIDLNDFFKEMEKLKKGKICFDIQDTMNRTRVKWSKELKCCHRDFNLTLFLVGSGIFCAIPLMFYIGMFAYTKRVERNHEVIDSTYGTARPQNSPSTSPTTYGAMSTREAPLNADEIDGIVKKNVQEDADSMPSTSVNAALIVL